MKGCNTSKSLDQSISIHWSMHFPPVKAKNWVMMGRDTKTSSDTANNLTKNHADRQLESQLNWPHGTLKALKWAFEANHSRHTGWNISTGYSQEALAFASKIYKRGVETNHKKPFLSSGKYRIEFRSSLNLLSENPYIIDEKVYRLWKNRLKTSPLLVIKACEAAKGLTELSKIYQSLASSEEAAVCIVGGGITADMSAFAASLAQKQFILVPTTLLSMVDACVGGKSGVNFHPYGKNQIGSFTFPQKVICDMAWLETLPPIGLKGGAAEGLKHCFISGDKKLAKQLTHCISQQLFNQLSEIIPHLIQVKAQVIKLDPGENGYRACLNLGHTLAHALEAIALDRNHKLEHGMAVGLGLAYIAYLSTYSTHLSPSEKDWMIDILKRCGCILPRNEWEQVLGLPLESNVLWELLWKKMCFDKKNQDHEPHWVLLDHIGQIHRPEPDRWVKKINKLTCQRAWLDLIQHL